MARRSTKSKRTDQREFAFAAVVNTQTGHVSLIEPGTNLFQALGRQLVLPNLEASEKAEATHTGRPGGARKTSDLEWYLQRGGLSSPRRYSRYQWLTGTVLPSLRDRLLPDEDDFEMILDQIDFYRRRIPWLNRGLMLRAAINASEFRVDAPNGKKKEQTEWLLDLKRRLRMFTLIREFFWSLRGYSQSVVLWRTKPRGRDPISIEIPDLKIYQPRWNPSNGARPNIVVVPSNDDGLKQLIAAEKDADENKKERIQKALKAYPKAIVKALRDAGEGERVEIPAEELEEDGMHFDFAALDRRHWEDWGFPGMYSIFPYLEMLMMADDADINALHHYKAGILLVRLGPEEPKDASLIATEAELKALDKKLTDMAKARLPAWAARGDLHVEWVVPPDHIISDAKVKSAREKVKDWIGLPKVSWPGEDFGGAYAAGLVTLKFLEQESEDDRSIAKELFESWFYDRSKETNKFEGAVWPHVWFDPTALKEQRLVLDAARLFLEAGGADMQTIAEMLGYDSEVWLARRADLASKEKEYQQDFLPQGGAQISGQDGRPPKTGQPTPEQQERRQPRPSTTDAIERTIAVIHRDFGISADELRNAVEKEGIVTA